MKATLALLATVALAAGCASFKGIETRGALADPADLKAGASLAGTPVSAAWPELDWWKRFGDSQLDRLVEEALAGSPGMRLARARADQALAAAQIVRAPLGPQVGAGVDVTRQRFSGNYIFPPPIGGSSFTTTQLALSFGHELDFWGKNRAAYDAALGRARAADAEGFAARLVLSSAVAGVYVQLARSHDQLDLARRELADREAVQRLTSERVRAGLDSKLELKQVETSIPAARVRIAQAEEQIALARNQLAALLGKGPDRGLAIERPSLHQLTSLRSVEVQRGEVDSALAAAEEAYSLAVTRYQAGIGSLLQVLAAEMQVLEQRTLRAELQARELAVSINLIRALGGGFDLQVAVQ